MKKNIFLIFSIMFLMSTACKTSRNAESRAYLKQYAFCKCVEYASGDKLFLKDPSKGVLLEISDYGVGVNEKIDSFTQVAALKIQPSVVADHEGKKAIFFECFKYYHSKALDSLVKKLDHMKIKGW